MNYHISLSLSGTIENTSGHLYLYTPGGTAEDFVSAGYNGTAEQVLFDLAQHLHLALHPDEPQPMAAGNEQPAAS